MMQPIFYPTRDNRVVLAKPFRLSKEFVIPAGYRSNGANIPRLFWWFIPPFEPKYLSAVIAHDWLCDKERYKEADEIFEELLLEIEDSFKTRLMIRAVRLYHKIRYGVKR